MNEIEKAIAELENRAGRALKTALSTETAKLAVEALREKQKRDKMLCVSCKHEPKNPTSKTLPCSMCSVAYASYFEPKENETGLSPAEVANLVQAKADGRLVVLPCKVGDTVYVNRKCLYSNMTYGESQFEPCEVIAFTKTRKQTLAKITPHKAQAQNSRYNMRFPISAFSKTVFLTKPEAQAAIDRMEERE